MTKEKHPIIRQLRDLFEQDGRLRSELQQTIEAHSIENPDLQTNPVRSFDDLYLWLERFLYVMPWEGLERGTKNNKHGLFRRIDQSIGYAYYILGDLQYEPLIAEWLKQYNTTWAEHLNSSESWNNEYYNLLKSDPLFELDSDKYESPDNWHCWNDFFSRKLRGDYKGIWLDENQSLTSPAEGVWSGWQNISTDNTIQTSEPIKTADVLDIGELLGDSKYKHSFAGGYFGHVTLDMYNYHHFHSPVDGKILEIQEIDGQLSSGGEIIWDAAENRYRYKYADNLGYQMIEKRVVIVIEQGARNNEQRRIIALIPVGVAQVGSVYIEKDIHAGAEVHRGQDLGHFSCGGSDVIILKANEC